MSGGGPGGGWYLADRHGAWRLGGEIDREAVVIDRRGRREAEGEKTAGGGEGVKRGKNRLTAMAKEESAALRGIARNGLAQVGNEFG